MVIGCRDPNPKAAGGAERLKQAGLEVTLGTHSEAVKTFLTPWFTYITQGVPYVSLKLALSLDGRIASRTGASKWITGPEARAKAHALRASHDAVMIGVNTAVTDNPELTVRDVDGRDPVRLIIDSRLRLPEDSHVVTTAPETPTCVITTTEASSSTEARLEAAGVSVIRVQSTAEGRCDMRAALQALAAREVVSVLCEGGAELAGSLLASRIPSELHAFIAPLLLGPRGKPGMVDWAGPDTPGEAPHLKQPRWELCGNDAYVAGSIVYGAPQTPPPSVPPT